MYPVCSPVHKFQSLPVSQSISFINIHPVPFKNFYHPLFLVWVLHSCIFWEFFLINCIEEFSKWWNLMHIIVCQQSELLIGDFCNFFYLWFTSSDLNAGWHACTKNWLPAMASMKCTYALTGALHWNCTIAAFLLVLIINDILFPWWLTSVIFQWLFSQFWHFSFFRV